jgi:acetyl esterase/lipase
MRSSGYVVVERIMKISGLKNLMKLGPEEMKKELEKKKNKQSSKPSQKLSEKHIINKENIDSKIYYIIKPKKNAKETVILFIHGGAYIKEMNTFYWQVVSKLVDALEATIYVPIYPLAPKYTYLETMDMLPQLYKKILKTYSNKNISILGDSAGGQIALSLSLLIHKLKLPQPKDLILISPMLSCSLSQKEKEKMEDIVDKDCILSPEFFQSAVQWWIKGSKEKDFLINPIYGDYFGLTRTTIFSGSYDILNVQVEPFIEMVKDKGLEVTYIRGEKMMHIWPYIPMVKEGDFAFKQILEIINKK